jgi:hypothetical protein
MQYKDYKIAEVKNNAEIVKRLSQVENELSRDLGKDVVLIAYQKDKATQV